MNYNVKISNAPGETIYNLTDLFSSGSGCYFTWKEFKPFELETGIYTARWTSIEGGQLGEKVFVVRKGQR